MLIPKRWQTLLRCPMACLTALAVLLSLANPQPTVGLDGDSTQTSADELVRQLVARRESLSQGSIQYEQFVLLTSPKGYSALTSEVSKSQAPTSVDIDRLLERVRAEDPVAKPLSGYRGTMYFRPGQTRIIRERLQGFGPSKEELERIAKDTGGRLRGYMENEDILYDDQNLLALDDQRRLVIRDPHRESAPGPQDLDVTLRPWKEYFGTPLNDGQTVSSFNRNGHSVLRYSTDKGPDRRSWIEYEFDPALGYAPNRVYGETNGQKAMEIIYSYCSNAATPAAPCGASYARFFGQEPARVELWLAREWKQTAEDSDFMLHIPDKCVLFDQRSGRGIPLTDIPAGDISTPQVAGILALANSLLNVATAPATAPEDTQSDVRHRPMASSRAAANGGTPGGAGSARLAIAVILLVLGMAILVIALRAGRRTQGH